MNTIKKKNLRRLTSLSTLGTGALAAGTLAVCVPNAQASSIIVVAVNSTIGTFGDAVHRQTFTLPGVANFSLVGHSTSSAVFFTNHSNRVFNRQSSVGLKAYALGALFSGVSGNDSGGPIVTEGQTNFTGTKDYFLFDFKDSNNAEAIRYGWGQVSIVFSGREPNVTFVQYAYDTSGAKIAAGDTGLPSPEPSSLALSGLGALVLGAIGIRRWKAARAA